MKDFVVVKTFNTRLEADVSKTLLDANGISSFISADDEGGMAPFPFRPTSKGVQLLVRKESFQKARKLLNNKS